MSASIHQSDEVLAAIKQAETMARVWNKDAAILSDLSIVKLGEVRGVCVPPESLRLFVAHYSLKSSRLILGRLLHGERWRR